MACYAPSSESLLRQTSRQSSGGDVFSDELDFLQNVYLDELTYESCDQGSHTLRFRVTPSTGDDKERQYVYLVLNITVTKEYPHVVPECSLGQSRGLSDTHLRSIQDGLCRRSEELLGCEMIYQLVEYTKECLTDNNLPSGECAICLSGFQESDEFRKTDCYHYFHLPCLADYLHYYQRQLLEDQEEDRKVDMMLRRKTRQLECPICRVSIDTSTLNFDPSKTMATPVKGVAFQPSPKLKAWQKKMEALLLKQRRKGGVIDTSQSDVIDGTWVSTVSINSKDDQSKSENAEDIKKCKQSLSTNSPKTSRKRNDYSRVKSYTYQKTDRKPMQEQEDGKSKSGYGRYRREDKKGGAHQSGLKGTRARDPVKSCSSKNNKHESEGATSKIPESKTVTSETTIIISGGTESISSGINLTSQSKKDIISKSDSRSKDRPYKSKSGVGRGTRRPVESGGARGKPGSRGLETKTTS